MGLLRDPFTSLEPRSYIAGVSEITATFDVLVPARRRGSPRVDYGLHVVTITCSCQPSSVDVRAKSN